MGAPFLTRFVREKWGFSFFPVCSVSSVVRFFFSIKIKIYDATDPDRNRNPRIGLVD
jgi:hypothetical protein